MCSNLFDRQVRKELQRYNKRVTDRKRMLDFVKIRIKDRNIINNLRKNRLLDWGQFIIENTGEVKEQSAIYLGLEFKLVSNRHFYITGSLHKFWNNLNGRGEQNFNDFNFSNLVEVIKELYHSFNLLPENCILENLEFGVNISPKGSVQDILRSAILHKGKPFTHEYLPNKYYRVCEYQQYLIKIYDKGIQYSRPENILRFEVKVRRMKYLKNTGIKTLADLLDTAKLALLGAILASNFIDILFFDNTIPNSIQHSLLTQGQAPIFWLKLHESNYNNYYKKRIRFKDLVKKHGTQDFQEIVGGLVTQKWNELLTSTPKTLQELTGVEKTDITEINHSDKGLKPIIFQPLINTQESGAEAPDKEMAPRYCITCGRDISNQRPTSKFCSAKYVGYLAAHKCRNADSNPRNRIKYNMERKKSLWTLFDILPYLKDYCVLNDYK
jgi:hypothetical protein